MKPDRTILIAFIIVAITIPINSFAQNTTDIYRNNEQIEHSPDIESDYTLFSVPLPQTDIFGRLIGINSPRSSYRILELTRQNRPYSIENVRIDNPLSGRVDFATLNTLRALCSTDDRYTYNITPSTMPHQSSVSFLYSDRSARLGLSALLSAHSRDERWYVRAVVTARRGRDAYIDGVFAQNYSVGFTIERKLPKDARIALAAGIAPTMEGLRSASTQEAFDLTGDNLYNPAWGYQDSRVRSSRIARRLNPFIAPSYHTHISPKSRLDVTALLTLNRYSSTAIARFSSSEPKPDYYRYMPSFFIYPDMAAYVAQQWQERNPDVVQVNWGNIYAQNTDPEKPSYIIEQRVDNNLTARFSALIATKLSTKTNIGYGVNAHLSRSNLFKVADNMLGTNSFEDIDQYLLDDEMFGDKIENNTLTRGRRVRQGDRFGYDTYIHSRGAEVTTQLTHTAKRVWLKAIAEIGTESFQRQGNYQKELYPGDMSLGRSKRYSFETYKIDAEVSFARIMNEVINLRVGFESAAPLYGNIFLSPYYNNIAVENPVSTKTFVSHVGYSIKGRLVSIQLRGGVSIRSGGYDIFRYYDDLSHTYSDLVLSGISTIYGYGTLSLSTDISSRVRLSATANIASAQYHSNPDVSITSDADQSVIVKGATSQLKGYKLGNIPSTVVAAQLDYSASMGLWGRIGVAYIDGRYADPAPTRRMARTTSAAGSPEAAEAIRAQTKLPASTVVNLALGRNFKIAKQQFSVRANVNNLLSNKNVIIYGYEQLRLRSYTSREKIVLEPMANKYLYDYGRNYALSISILL